MSGICRALTELHLPRTKTRYWHSCDRTYNEDENLGQHHRIFSNIFASIFGARVPKKTLIIVHLLLRNWRTTCDFQEGWGTAEIADLIVREVAGLHLKCSADCAAPLTTCVHDFGCGLPLRVPPQSSNRDVSYASTPLCFLISLGHSERAAALAQ